MVLYQLSNSSTLRAKSLVSIAMSSTFLVISCLNVGDALAILSTASFE